MNNPGRSLLAMLFVPGNGRRFLLKARQLDVPALILDLEDSVPAEAKAAGRASVCEFLGEAPATAAEQWVRVNSVGSGWIEEDLEATVGPNLAGVIVPKVERRDDLAVVLNSLSRLETERSLVRGSIEVIPIIESARGVVNARHIASVGERLHTLAFGAADFCADLGLHGDGMRSELSPTVVHAQVEIVLACRAEGLRPPHDGAFTRVRDAAGLALRCRAAKELGFSGKHAIHPDQVPVIVEAFRPSDKEVVAAREVLLAFEKALMEGRGAIEVNGQMIDEAMVAQARGLIAWAEPPEQPQP